MREWKIIDVNGGKGIIFLQYLATFDCLIRGVKCSVRSANMLGHESSNSVVYATSKGLDQPSHTLSLIRAFASHLCDC